MYKGIPALLKSKMVWNEVSSIQHPFHPQNQQRRIRLVAVCMAIPANCAIEKNHSGKQPQFTYLYTTTP
jgi:hypothetical protein